MFRPASLAVLMAVLGVSAAAQNEPKRPRITGVAGMRLFALDIPKTRDFYGKTLGLRECRTDAVLCFQVNTAQMIEFEHLTKSDRLDRLIDVKFETANVSALLKYMVAKGINSMDDVTRVGQTPILDVSDPDNHTVEFVQHRSIATRRSMSRLK